MPYELWFACMVNTPHLLIDFASQISKLPWLDPNSIFHFDVDSIYALQRDHIMRCHEVVLVQKAVIV